MYIRGDTYNTEVGNSITNNVFNTHEGLAAYTSEQNYWVKVIFSLPR